MGSVHSKLREKWKRGKRRKKGKQAGVPTPGTSTTLTEKINNRLI